jgi:two-component system LytT family response regulator
MIKSIVVDDEQVGIDIICAHIQMIPELVLAGSYRDSIKALNSIDIAAVDVIFLDIDMPNFTGLDFIEALKARKGAFYPRVILTTSHDEHAIKSYELGVADYLLKPISFKRFKIAIERLKDNLQKDSVPEQQSAFMFVEAEGKKIKIDFVDLLYVEAAGNYIKLFTSKGNQMLYTSMSIIETQLPANMFARIHNSFIIAIGLIRSVTRNEVILSFDSKHKAFPIGVKYRKAFLKKLGI